MAVCGPAGEGQWSSWGGGGGRETPPSVCRLLAPGPRPPPAVKASPAPVGVCSPGPEAPTGPNTSQTFCTIGRGTLYCSPPAPHAAPPLSTVPGCSGSPGRGLPSRAVASAPAPDSWWAAGAPWRRTWTARGPRPQGSQSVDPAICRSGSGSGSGGGSGPGLSRSHTWHLGPTQHPQPGPTPLPHATQTRGRRGLRRHPQRHWQRARGQCHASGPPTINVHFHPRSGRYPPTPRPSTRTWQVQPRCPAVRLGWSSMPANGSSVPSPIG